MRRTRLTLLSFLLIVGVFWLRNPLVFISEDCYFYAVVARNLALRGVQSFWGTQLTNGVHPLWLYVLASWEWCVALVDRELLYRAAFGVPLVLVIMGVGAASWIRAADRARLPAASVYIPLLFLSLFGLLYSEAHTAFLAHALLFLAVSREEREERPQPILVGLALAAVALARLDNVFYVGAFGAWYAVRRADRRATVLAAATCALPVLLYLASNQVFFGGLVPISGALKSTFPVPHVGGLSPSPGGMVLMWSGYSVPFGWLPIGVGLLTAVVMRRRLTGLQTLLYPLLAGSIGHALYIALFTAGFTFWYWYYLLPVVLLGWSLGCLMAPGVGPRIDAALQWSAVGVLAVALAATRMQAPTEERLTGLKTLRVVRNLGLDGATLLVAEWPGTVAFHTHNQVIAADMLTSNRRFVNRLLAAPDAGPELLAAAREQGSPVDFVVYNGGLFLIPDLGSESVELRSPRMVDTLTARPIGRLVLGPPYAAVDRVVVWRTPSTGQAASGR